MPLTSSSQILLLAFAMLFALATAEASTLIDPQTPVAAGADLPRDVSGNDLIEDEALSEDVSEQEFSPDEAEVRSESQKLVAIGIGEAFAWQSWSLEVGAALGHNQLSVFAGGGNFGETSLRRSSGALSIDAATRSVGLAMRSWLSRAPIVSGAASLSWGIWNGSITPIGVDEDVAGSTSDLLPGSFRLTGLTLALAPGLSRSWPGGFWIEWVPVGLRRTWVLSRSWSRPTPVDGAVVDWVERFEVWGFVNLKLGWRF